jgi:hypothetical protein
LLDARNHYPTLKHHTPPPKQGNNTPTPPHPQQVKRRACCLRTQQCVWRPPPADHPVNQRRFVVAHPAGAHYRPRPLITAHTPPVGARLRGAP